MSLVYVFIASILAAAVNFCLRKNLEQQKSSQGYLALYFIFSFVISFFLREINLESFSFVMGSVGAITGLLNFLMMVLTARCLQIGTSGLTFAFQNSASVFPSLLLYSIFGATYGFTMTFPAFLGFGLIVLGLFLSSRIQKNSSSSNQSFFVQWIILLISIFLIQGMILTLFQWRCLLLTDPLEPHPLIPWKCSLENEAWFMPGFFFIPAILQTLIFTISEKRWVSLREFFLGFTGGILNGGATFFLLLATEQASTNEKMILFPLFAVSVIFLCNLWGMKFYQERVYWPGMALCLAGVLIGALIF